MNYLVSRFDKSPIVKIQTTLDYTYPGYDGFEGASPTISLVYLLTFGHRDFILSFAMDERRATVP